MYKKLLSSLGLNDNESTLYEILLSQGPQTAKQLLGKIALTRSNIYNVMGNLTKLGLITEAKDRSGRTIFRAEPPAKLESILTEKEQELTLAKRELNTCLPSLEQMFVYTQDRPVVKYYEGYEKVKKIYEETLLDKPEEIWAIVSMYSFKLMDGYLSEYSKKRKNLNIKTKIISSREITPEMLEQDVKLNKERRFYQTSFPTEINIFKNKVALISYREKVLGMIIEDKDYADTMRILFMGLWSTAENPYLGKTKNN